MGLVAGLPWEMVMTFLGLLKAADIAGEFTPQLIQIVNPMGAEGGGIADKLPPDCATEPIVDGDRQGGFSRLWFRHFPESTGSERVGK